MKTVRAVAVFTTMHEPSASDGHVVNLTSLRQTREGHAAPWRVFQAAVDAIATSSTVALISRIETESDPLILWEIHQELDRRNIPPALRFPKSARTPQLEFVTWLADIYWFTRRNPSHKPRFDNWRALFGPYTDRWHESAAKVFEFAQRRGYGAAYYTKGFALDDNDRRQLMTVKTSGQIARQRKLKQAEDVREAIVSYTLAHPDKSGQKRPGEVARRRYLIWKTYILCDQGETAAARYFEQIYGEAITRKSVQNQVAAVELAWQEFGPARCLSD